MGMKHEVSASTCTSFFSSDFTTAWIPINVPESYPKEELARPCCFTFIYSLLVLHGFFSLLVLHGFFSFYIIIMELGLVIEVADSRASQISL